VSPVYKKRILSLCTFFIIGLGIPISAHAATPTCTTTESVVDTSTSTETKQDKVNESNSAPLAPEQKANVNNRALKTSDFTVAYQYSYDMKKYTRTVTVKQVKVVKKCSDGTSTTTYRDDTTYGSWTFVSTSSHVENKSGTVDSVSKTGGSAHAGYEEFAVYVSSPAKSNVKYGGYRSYYVNKIVVTVNKKTTYEKDAQPTATCVKYYGYGEGSTNSASCTSALTKTTDNDKQLENICFSYTENDNTGKDCSTRVHVKSLAIIGPDKVYTGQHHTFRCLATLYDGTSYYVENNANVMSSAPYSYIGTDWYNTGYNNPQGGIIKPNGPNDFYSADNLSRTYTIKCAYPADSALTVEKKVQHIGIKNIDIDASGYFETGANEFKYIAQVDKTKATKGEFENADFITGHWYDFKATLIYDDNTKRDITSAPEVFWTGYPWYDGMPAYEKANSYDTNMVKSGIGHRIPQQGKNMVLAEYFNRNVPYGGNPTGTYDNNFASRNFMSFQAKQIQKIEIKGKNYTSAPKTTVNEGESVQYSAWVTWTDGTKEDWTDSVKWSGDYSKGHGLFTFNFKGNNNKTTVAAIYEDLDKISGTGKENWDSTYSKLEVTVKANCATADTLTVGCDVPTGNWQTEPLNFFEKKNINFLPAPSAFGYSGNSWKNSDGSVRDEYPYQYNFKFNVSGVSEGNGRK